MVGVGVGVFGGQGGVLRVIIFCTNSLQTIISTRKTTRKRCSSSFDENDKNCNWGNFRSIVLGWGLGLVYLGVGGW